MATPQWVHEFGPEYGVPDVPSSSGLSDHPWHNDAVPSYGFSGDQELRDPVNGDIHDLRLWVDHVDPAQREFGVRFMVTYQPWSAVPVDGVTITDDSDLYAGDDLDAALEAVAKARAAIVAALKERQR